MSDLENNKQSGINEIFEQRKRIYQLSFPCSASKRRALKTWRGSEATFEDWMRVRDDPESDPILKKVALHEMSKRAVSLEEKIRVYIRSVSVSKKAKLLKDISKIDATFEKWDAIINDPNSDYALRKVAIYKMEEVTLVSFRKKLRQKKRGWWGKLRNLIHIIYIKLFSRHRPTFEEWEDIYYGAPPGSKLRKDAVIGMTKTAITYKQWQEVYGKTEAGSKIEKTAFRWMEKLGKK